MRYASISVFDLVKVDSSIERVRLRSSGIICTLFISSTAAGIYYLICIHCSMVIVQRKI